MSTTNKEEDKKVSNKETEDNNINNYNLTTNLCNHNNQEKQRMQAKDNTINLK